MEEPHSVTFGRLASPASANRQPYLKITFFLIKKSGLSDQEFHSHWETVHADLTVAAKGFREIQALRYVQVGVFSPKPSVPRDAKSGLISVTVSPDARDQSSRGGSRVSSASI